MRSSFDMEASYFKFGNVSDRCEVGLDFYERAERASNDHNFEAIHIPYIALHIFPVITSICQAISDLTLHCTV